jgi:hypothetical protein
MLRLTWLPDDPRPTLRFEGKLFGPWVGEARAECERLEAPSPLRLDLSAVTYVDAEGAGLLRERMRRGDLLVGCSAFVAEMLQRADS